MENLICPIPGCKTQRQKKGKNNYKTCCRRHTKMRRVLGYKDGEMPKRYSLHKNYYQETNKII